jgi:hypothetical protein
LEDKQEEKVRSEYKSVYYKIGIAGFCFGNIMLLSFPEYLSIDVAQHDELKKIFAVLNIILSLPVFFYSASDYFISALNEAKPIKGKAGRFAFDLFLRRKPFIEKKAATFVDKYFKQTIERAA